MPLFEFEGRKPEVSPTAWIAPTATLVGDVRVEAEASIWYGAVLRADFGLRLTMENSLSADSYKVSSPPPADVLADFSLCLGSLASF